MAVDELLLRDCDQPTLRVYEWEGDWVSLGYFSPWEEAHGLDVGPPVRFVRRATGGGIVDHRHDATYTLVVPGSDAMVKVPRSRSYRMIHEALADALRDVGIGSSMLGEPAGASGLCFGGGVESDLVGEDGGKIAGAAQRRTRGGLLHQGSVLVGDHGKRRRRAREALTGGFPRRLAREVLPGTPGLEAGAVTELAESKYAAADWLERSSS